MIADDLTAVVEGAYAMALDPALLADWTLRTAATFGASLGTVGICSSTGELLRQSIFCDRPQAIERFFEDGIDRLDPQFPIIKGIDRLSLFLDSDYRNEENPETATFLSYVRSNCHVDCHMTAIFPLAASGGLGGLSLSRAVVDGPTPTVERERLAAILRPLGNAFRLAVDHAEKLDAAYWEGLQARLGEPALLLDERGRIIRTTDSATRLLRRSDALDIIGGRLRSGDAAIDDRLQRILGDAVHGRTPVVGSIRLPHRSGRPALILSAFPLVRSQRGLAPHEAAALVTVIDPVGRPESAAPLWAHAFGLTPRESQFATSLLAGHSVESASATLGISIATGRLHLRRLLAKTDTARQVDMICLLARF